MCTSWKQLGQASLTVDISQRVQKLQGCFPYQLKLLTFIPGGPNLERTLHMLFHEHRFRGMAGYR